MDMSETDAERRLERAFLKQKQDELFKRNRMIVQKITGILLAILLIGGWYMLGDIGYAPVMLVLIGAAVWLIVTPREVSEEK